jgi:serine/threonine protein phosphatase PrpC
MKFSVFQVSRRGGRAKNEDRMGYCYTRDSGLFVLADGMGGHPQGEVAAQLALQTVSSLYQQQARTKLPRVNDFLAESLMAAHRRILRHAGENGLRDTPRTTFVAAVVQGNSVSWVHCGDSRLYLVRDGTLLTRTRDHSYLEQAGAELAHLGRFNRNVLYTCLGSPTLPAFDVAGPIPLQHGDKILLCSDGLWSSVSDADIVRHLRAASVSHAVPELVELALRKAGDSSDNVTVLALEWEAADAFASTCGAGGDTIGDSVFASTIQATEADELAHSLDEAAIERTIAEINETIRRTAARKG